MFNPVDVQGNILRGYRKPRVRYLILEVADRNEARRWLAASVSGRKDTVPQITTEEPWGKTKPDTTFNIGLTFEGLRALGVAEQSLDTFPTEFKEGMTARAAKLGDVGDGAPNKWPEPFDKPSKIHLIATIYADQVTQLNSLERQALEGAKGSNSAARATAIALTATTFTSAMPTISRNRSSRKSRGMRKTTSRTRSRWLRSAPSSSEMDMRPILKG